MFGSIAWFLESNGAMFTTVTGEGVGVRLGEERTAELVDSGEARSFPPGSKWPMREYVFFDGDRVTEDDILLALLEEASDYAGTLPPARKKTRKKS
jgi:hypothetical protein